MKRKSVSRGLTNRRVVSAAHSVNLIKESFSHATLVQCVMRYRAVATASQMQPTTLVLLGAQVVKTLALQLFTTDVARLNPDRAGSPLSAGNGQSAEATWANSPGP